MPIDWKKGRAESPMRKKYWKDCKVGDEVVKPVENTFMKFASFGTAKHVGVYIGKDLVVEVGGDKGEKIKQETIESWKPKEIFTGVHAGSKSANDKIIDRASWSCNRDWNYSDGANNCQHFVNWCRTGVFFSYQYPLGSKPTKKTYWEDTISEGEMHVHTRKYDRFIGNPRRPSMQA